MAVLVHEVWECDEPADEFPMVCLAGPRGADARRLNPPQAKLVWTFEAGCHFEAMTRYYDRMGWGTYTTDQEWDHSPYPEEWLDEQRRA